mgnify:CR=1 FL=1
MSAGVRAVLFAAVLMLAAPLLGRAQETHSDESTKALIATILAEQINSQWTPPQGQAGEPVRVTLSVQLSRDGRVTGNQTTDVSGGSDDAEREAAVDAALAAVNHFLTEPFVGLPAEHYDIWKSFTMTLDPRQRAPS